MRYFKKLLLLIFLSITTFFSWAQEKSKYLSGIVEYEIFIAGSESIDTVSDLSQKKMLSKIKAVLDSKTFILQFDKDKAFFKSMKVMPIKGQENDPILKIANILSREYKIYYKNLEDNIKFRQVEFSGEKLIIEENFNESEWKISKETKKILGFMCFKASKEITEYNPITKQTRHFFPEVWFCPSLNFPFGPIGLDGLPGLVLEGSINNKFIYRAKSINLNNPEVSFPKLKGKKVTKDEYNEMLNNINN